MTFNGMGIEIIGMRPRSPRVRSRARRGTEMAEL